MDGPGARAAMERGKDMALLPVYDPIGDDPFPQGDPDFFKEWAYSVIQYHQEKA